MSDTWDEYQWERLLQDQEKRTEKYMELLEKYMSHPQRDEIIAREMGWSHISGGDEQDWEEEVDAAFEKEFAESGGDLFGDGEVFGFQKHPLYCQAVAFASELDSIFDRTPAATQEHAATIALHTHVTLAAAKLAAALNDDVDEPGMSIAYLKRALHAIHAALGANATLADGAHLPPESSAKILARLFTVRDGIVANMGDYRAEFRRRTKR